jgi:hypothetical protein
MEGGCSGIIVNNTSADSSSGSVVSSGGKGDCTAKTGDVVVVVVVSENDQDPGPIPAQPFFKLSRDFHVEPHVTGQLS